MKGTLEIKAINIKTRDVITYKRFNNVVVNGFNEQMCRMLAGDIGTVMSRRNVVVMQFGTGTEEESESDISLKRPLALNKDVIISFPSIDETGNDSTVEFSCVLEANEGNGFPISEVGLICGNNTLAARKTFSAINKTSNMYLEFIWRIAC